LRDERLLEFIRESRSPITEKDLGLEFAFVIRNLRKYFKVLPKQVRAKQSLTSVEEIVAAFKTVPALRPSWRKATIDALPRLLRDFSLGALLYRNYRCGVIHEYEVLIEEEGFFSKREIEWKSVLHTYVSASRLVVQFPATVLLRILESCIENYAQELQHKKKLPANIFFEVCDPLADSGALDVDSVAAGRPVRFSR
jgi:hypothetical protein